MIVFGVKPIRKNRGIVAAFCPLRNRICEFRVVDLRSAFHIWFIPVGGSVHRQFELHDKEAKIAYVAGRDTAKRAVRKPTHDSISDLATSTNPEAIQTLELYDRLEQACRDAPPMSEDRIGFLTEKFLAAEFSFQRASVTGPSESISALLALLFIASTAVAVISWQQWAWWQLPASVAALLLPVVIWRAVVSTKRAGLRPIAAHLAGAVENISPTIEELEAARLEAHNAGLGVAKAMKLQDLLMLLDGRKR